MRKSARFSRFIKHVAGCLLIMVVNFSSDANGDETPLIGKVRAITQGPGGRILTNTGVWSPDNRWLIYDVRSDPSGDLFDGTRIESVNVETGEVRVLYQSLHGACCGVATHHPRRSEIVFILGPEHPTPDWQYAQNHRQGVVVDIHNSNKFTRLDARDLVPPLTPGALRGGTHVHVWDAAGEWLSFTYNDALAEPGLRDIGIAVPGHPVHVKSGHPRNHDGDWFCALVTRTVPMPRPGSDEIKRANEEGWIGTNGYLRSDGTRQRRAIAFQGHLVTEQNNDVIEVFVVDLPDELSASDLNHAALSPTGRIEPLPGARQRRLTFTTNRRFPGIQGVRHWLRSSPDGSRIAVVMKDDAGTSQIWTVTPATGQLNQLTHNKSDVTSALSWSSDGRWIAYGMGGKICLTNASTGQTHPVTHHPDGNSAESIRNELGEIQKESCVISPDDSKIAFVRSKRDSTGTTNQICVIWLEKKLTDQ